MRITTSLILADLIARAPATQSPPNLASLPEELLEADRAFNRITQDTGSEGWVSFFLDDGRMLLDGGPIVEGSDGIREVMAALEEPVAYSLRWEPIAADMSAVGDLGYTWGRYDREVRRSPSETRAAEGKSLTVWRRDPGGAWKVTTDIGNSGAADPGSSPQD